MGWGELQLEMTHHPPQGHPDSPRGMSPAGLSSDSAIPVWWVSCSHPDPRNSKRGTQAGLRRVHSWTHHVRFPPPPRGGGSQERMCVVLVHTCPSQCPASASPAMPRQMPSSCAAGRGYPCVEGRPPTVTAPLSGIHPLLPPTPLVGLTCSS